MSDLNLYLLELKDEFFERRFFGKADLREFYGARSPDLSEKTFRRILYALEKHGLIISVDSGVYSFPEGYAAPRKLNKFIPTFSPELQELNDSIRGTFPYAEYLLWETRALHEFMLHQPGRSQIILETERENAESVFNYLNARDMGNAFLQPDRVTFERYVLPRSESIIVMPLLSQAPSQKVQSIPTPKLEKILVDVFIDEKIFYVFHGEELAHIFQTAFERYQISQKTIFRYAQRRKIDRKVRDFILQNTKIELIQKMESCE